MTPNHYFNDLGVGLNHFQIRKYVFLWKNILNNYKIVQLHVQNKPILKELFEIPKIRNIMHPKLESPFWDSQEL